MDPHWDFYPPSPYDRKFSECGPKRGAWRTPAEKVSPELRQRTIDAYDGEIAYCDSVLSNLVESVRKTPRWNETIIVIAGDHGERFWERGYSGHGNALYDLELKVPLLIRIPPSRAVQVSEGSVVRGQVGGLDVAPTLLDFAGVPIPASWAGRSLRSDMENGRSDGRPVVSETRIRGGLWQRAVRTDRWKVIAVDDFSRPCAVYHLTTDPHEKTNLVQRGVSFPVEVTDLFPLLQPKEGR
jgi:arylsulfatase A-like enzyme